MNLGSDRYMIPLDKVRIPQELDHSRNHLCILISCGSFSPITFQHVRNLEIARNYLERETRQFEVLGGFISPVHDEYQKEVYFILNNLSDLAS